MNANDGVNVNGILTENDQPSIDVEGWAAELTPRQIAALRALSSGQSPADAARTAGVSLGTVYRWLNTDATFSAALQALEGAALRDLARRLGALGEAVGRALEDGLAPTQSIGTRLKAADIVLSRLLAMAEMAQVIRRLEALEAEREREQEGI